MIIQGLKNYNDTYIGIVRGMSIAELCSMLKVEPDDAKDKVHFSYNNQLMKMMYIGNNKGLDGWTCYGPIECYQFLFGSNFKEM